MGKVKTSCKECGGKGYAEIIEHWERPCDACHGKGFLFLPRAMLVERKRND